MTPAARVAAAIGILDLWLAGEPVEKTLTTWARQNRFAGSGDRAAIRDHVFDAVRCRASFAALGGAETGRGLMLGALRAEGADPDLTFTGAGHAPPPLTGPERVAAVSLSDLPEEVRLDCPGWLAPSLRRDLGDDFAPVMEALRHRAPVFVRVNLLKADHAAAEAALQADGVVSAPHPLSPTARTLTLGARRLKTSRAYADGLVELQDAASQAVADAVPDPGRGGRVLDYCAGGGGKALAIAARAGARVLAHDADPGRMRDLPARAARAGADIACLSTDDLAGAGLFEVVLADAPCSGSGAWRRQPEAKWRLTQDRLDDLVALQRQVLAEAAARVAPGGRLVYATCSLLSAENEGAVAALLAADPRWGAGPSRRLKPLDGGDGFFVSELRRA